MPEKTCCFIGHRKIEDTPELRARVRHIVEELITAEGFDTFLLGSNGEFNTLCREILAELKEKYPHIKRIYVRAEFPYIHDDYHAFLLESYEDTYYPQHMLNSGKAAYVERNCHMIDRSQVCVAYYEPSYTPPRRKASRNSIGTYQPASGTKIACNYAIQKKKRVIPVQIIL